ncbi:MAG: C40 family peptidase [Candidatus Solibacter usitatus]|nr:C40 family peptidase [Candidatus Solibacter usitatus]
MRLILLMILAAGAAMSEESAVVVTPVLNMHSKPTVEADVVSQAIYGLTVGVLGEQDGWLRIKTPGDSYTGWAESAGLRKLPEGETYAASGRVATVESLRAHLYREASVTRHRPLLTVPFDARLEIVEERAAEDGRWLAARLPDGRRAWVQRGDLSFDPKVKEIPELIELSKRFLGLPYTWGGASSFGYDCSGFTQMLVRRGGVQMPRDAQPQADWERQQKVEKSGLQAGDLLYFGASLKKITHTGFYIGNGEFIHSTTSDSPVIQISRLGDEKWTKLLVGCRRWKQ